MISAFGAGPGQHPGFLLAGTDADRLVRFDATPIYGRHLRRAVRQLQPSLRQVSGRYGICWIAHERHPRDGGNLLSNSSHFLPMVFSYVAKLFPEAALNQTEETRD